MGASKSAFNHNCIFIVTLSFSFVIELIDIVVHAVKACLPDMAVLLCPLGNFLQGRYVDGAGSILRFLPLCDQAGTLQYSDVLGNGRQTHIERLGEFVNGCFPFRQAAPKSPAVSSLPVLQRSGLVCLRHSS